MKRGAEKTRIIRSTERHTKIEIDGDTIYIRLPGKNRSVAYEIRKISNEYWTLDGTLPTSLTIRLQCEGGTEIDTPIEPGSDRCLPIPIDLDLVATEYGLTRREYDITGDLARRVLTRYKIDPSSFEESSPISMALAQLEAGEMIGSEEANLLHRMGYLNVYKGRK